MQLAVCIEAPSYWIRKISLCGAYANGSIWSVRYIATFFLSCWKHIPVFPSLGKLPPSNKETSAILPLEENTLLLTQIMQTVNPSICSVLIEIYFIRPDDSGPVSINKARILTCTLHAMVLMCWGQHWIRYYYENYIEGSADNIRHACKRKAGKLRLEMIFLAV